jgi:CPA1 family monovalent cation:H+ antiporter
VDSIHAQLATVLVLLLAVTLLSLAATRVHLPYPTVMVLGGLAICFIPHLPVVHLDPEAIFLLFLPPLLYAAAWYTSWRDFRANLRPIALLAIGFVLFTTFAVGVVAHTLIPGMPWAAAFTLGAIISPPDAVAATAIANRLGIPRRIITILEGESLLNDATGLTIYKFAVVAASTGAFSLLSASGVFMVASVGGVLLGLLIGLGVVQLHMLLDDPVVETVFTLLTPFATYLIAETVGVSGVLAVVVAGLYVSRRSSRLFSSRTRLTAVAVWNVLIFLLNGLVFVLIGLQLRFILSQGSDDSMSQRIGYALLLCLVMVIVRILWVFPASYLPRWLIPGLARRDPSPPWQSVFLIAFTGMRGVDSLAAALAIPVLTAAGTPFPRRGLIIFLTFAVILFTLVIQSLSLPWLIRALGLQSDEDTPCQENEARLRVARAALRRLDDLSGDPDLDPPTIEHLRRYYTDRLKMLNQRCELPPQEGQEKSDTAPIDYYDRADLLHRDLINAEREHLLELRTRGNVSDEVFRRIERDLDLEEQRFSADPADA